MSEAYDKTSIEGQPGQNEQLFDVGLNLIDDELLCDSPFCHFSGKEEDIMRYMGILS